MRPIALAFLSLGLFVPAAFAAEAGLRPLADAFDSLREIVRHLPPLRPIAPFEAPKDLPRPEQAVLDALAARVPGLAVDKVRLVPLENVLAAMNKAAEQKLTYLQILTGDLFKRDEIYYVPKDVIAAVEARFSTGTVPLSGTTTDGKPFRMEAFLGGQGRIHYLYDRREDFKFRDADAKRDFMIKNGGHIEARIEGPSDVSISGLSVNAFMSMFTDIQRIAQTSASRIHVTTGMGSGDGDIFPIRAK